MQWKQQGGSLARKLAAAMAISVGLLLAACGGGGDSGGNKSPSATPVSISSQPADQTVTAGNAASFTVVASGDGLAYKWQSSTNGGSTWVDSSGATAPTLTLSTTTLAMTGTKYRVVVSGTANSVTSSVVTLTVVGAVTAPVITSNVSSTSAVTGTAANFAVTATGTSLAYQWQSSPDGIVWADIVGATAPSYSLVSASLADNGRAYRVVVSNSAGSVTSSMAILTVTAAAAAPAFTTQPASTSAIVNQQATFTVAVVGTPAPTLQWQVSTNGGSTFVNCCGTATTYSTANLTSSDNGNRYRVVATNSAGTVTSNVALLTVTAASVVPSITTQPASVSVVAGAQASVSVIASGSPTPTYQWQKSIDGGSSYANINGATAASYSTAVLAVADSGLRLRVVVSNSAGSATSSAAVVTVTAPTSVLSGRAWQTGQALETNDNPVYAADAAMDDSGKVTVLFAKSDGSRVTLWATRGTPGAAGVAPSFTTPVAIDTAAPYNYYQYASKVGFSVGVSSNGNAVAAWRNTAPCKTTTYSTSGTCYYYYTARWLASNPTWDAPVLVGDAPYDYSLQGVGITNGGDILVFTNAWERTTSYPYYSVWPSATWRRAGQAAFQQQLFKGLSFVSGNLHLDNLGNMVLVGSMNQNATTDIVAYRGNTTTGFSGTQEILDTRGAAAVFDGSWIGENGHTVVIWTQNNGTKSVEYAAVLDAPAGAWSVSELTLPAVSFSSVTASVTPAGEFIWHSFDRCTTMRRTGGVWTSEKSMASGSCTASYSNYPAFTNDGNFLRVSEGSGSWMTFDDNNNAIVNGYTSASTGPGYVMGVPVSLSGSSTLLSKSGIGFYYDINTFDVLPTIAMPKGDARTVNSLWGWYFK